VINPVLYYNMLNSGVFHITNKYQLGMEQASFHIFISQEETR